MPFHYARANRRTGTGEILVERATGRSAPSYPHAMTDDHGSNKAIGGAALQLVGGLLTAIYFGYLDGLRNPISIGLGVIIGGYFVISGSVRVVVGYLTRRAG